MPDLVTPVNNISPTGSREPEGNYPRSPTCRPSGVRVNLGRQEHRQRSSQKSWIGGFAIPIPSEASPPSQGISTIAIAMAGRESREAFWGVG